MDEKLQEELKGLCEPSVDEEDQPKSYDVVDTWRLIENNLDHIECEFRLPSPYLFRIAKESYQLLYRFMIEVLSGTNGHAILQGKTPHRSTHNHYYRFGDKPWVFIEKNPSCPANCKKAWRFTAPELADPPWTTPQTEAQCRENEERPRNSGIISFYVALAKVQAEAFMRQTIYMHPISVSDEEMSCLEWLHERVRNEFEHFEPITLLTCRGSMLQACQICISKSQEILAMCVPYPFEKRKSIGERLQRTMDLLGQIQLPVEE